MNKESIITNNKRKYFRIGFDKPICAEMTISTFHGKIMRMGYSNVCVKDIGPGGLAFLSFLMFPIDEGIIYTFKIAMFNEEVRLRGTIVRTKDLTNNAHEYGIKFQFLENDEPKYIQLFNKLSFAINKTPEQVVCRMCKKEVFPCKL